MKTHPDGYPEPTVIDDDQRPRTCRAASGHEAAPEPLQPEHDSPVIRGED